MRRRTFLAGATALAAALGVVRPRATLAQPITGLTYTDDLGTDPAQLAAALRDSNDATGIDYGA